MKRIISIVLIALMLCSALPVVCFADEGNNSRASDYFSSYGANLSRQSDGRIKIVFSATGNTICTQIGVATYQIQEKDSSGDWNDFGSTQSGKTGSNVSSYTFSKYFTPNSGCQYRVKCTFTCTLNGTTEHKAYTSGTIRG